MLLWAVFSNPPTTIAVLILECTREKEGKWLLFNFQERNKYIYVAKRSLRVGHSSVGLVSHFFFFSPFFNPTTFSSTSLIPTPLTEVNRLGRGLQGLTKRLTVN